MMPTRAIACMLALAAASGPVHAQDAAPRTAAFDGTWFVSLDCADTQDRNGVVKGYRFAFDAHVADGRLDAQYGLVGQPSSLHLTGDVRDGGVLELRADGVSGPPEYVVGRAVRGTPYLYTMTGRLDGARGEASRREVRPCTALFVKKENR